MHLAFQVSSNENSGIHVGRGRGGLVLPVQVYIHPQTGISGFSQQNFAFWRFFPRGPLAVYSHRAMPRQRDATKKMLGWWATAPQDWVRPHVGGARLPLHRLRGLYADHVLRETEEAILARQAALKAASLALGHTSTKTTADHYVSAETPHRRRA